MDELITATDLNAWSATRHAQGHLPSLIRAAIMATVAPSSIRFPAAEGVGEPGLDGVLEVTDGAPPFVPAGRSVWEIGTSEDVGRKASADYRKRAKQLSAEERKRTTFVFVTSRTWAGARAWAKRKSASKDGWVAVLAWEAQDLATWLETVPGVRARFSELLGRQPYGVQPLSAWVKDWCEQANPPLPLDLMLAGRRSRARDLAAALQAGAGEHVVPTASREEGVAFLAAALLAPTLADEPPDKGVPQEASDDAAEAADESDLTASVIEGGREALAERTLVVHDAAAWRRCLTYDQAVVLVPLFDEPNVSAARRAGHQVVTARRALPSDAALLPIDRVEARRAWERQGLTFGRADDLARSARRSLLSLRRRIGRSVSHRRPLWATDSGSASLLAPLLLAGAWRDDCEGDLEVVAALGDGRPWRTAVRELTRIRTGEDAPINERDHGWEFVDVVDAWDSLADAVTSGDLDVFQTLVKQVLSEPDPAAALNAEQRRERTFSLENPLPRRRHSNVLRRGLADTLALLGSVVGQRQLAGGRTGEQHADGLVYALLHDADAERWRALADLLPLLAEAAPTFFLDAVEQSLHRHAPPVMALFSEQPDPFGMSPSSEHTPLLWALERLAFSPQHLSRVAVVLARLAALDPGGRLANRPAASLRDALHLTLPQSAVTAATRLDIVDSVRSTAPAVAWKLMRGLIRALDRGMILNRGPRRRDWIVPKASTFDIGELAGAVAALAERLAADAGTDAARWCDVVDLIDRLPSRALAGVLAEAARRWEELTEDGAAEVSKRLAQRITQHEEHPRGRWTLPAADLQLLQDFLADHPPPTEPAADARSLFSYRPRLGGRDIYREPELVASSRQDAVQLALAGGITAVIALAAEVDQPWIVGAALAAVSSSHDDTVLDLLNSADQGEQQLAGGLAAKRHADDPGWLATTVRSRPQQAVPLLLTADISHPVLDLLDPRPGRAAGLLEAGPTVASRRRRSRPRRRAVPRPRPAVQRDRNLVRQHRHPPVLSEPQPAGDGRSPPGDRRTRRRDPVHGVRAGRHAGQARAGRCRQHRARRPRVVLPARARRPAAATGAVPAARARAGVLRRTGRHAVPARQRTR